MKKLIYVFLSVVATVSIVSCSSSDDSNSDDNSNNTPFAIPLAAGNYWKYDVLVDVDTYSDSLYIANDTVIANKTYKKFKTQDIPVGFYSSSLNENGVIYEDGKVLLSGSLDLAQGQGLPTAVNLSVTDLVVFNKNANNGDALNATPVTGTTQQDYQGITFDIDYELNTYAGETFSSFTSPDGTVYSNVKSSVVKLNLTVSNSLLNINILSDPEVMTSTLYFADGIGMVYSKTDLNIAINSSVVLPNIPQNTNQSQEEFLTDYLLN